MKAAPYSLYEAQEICREYSHLPGVSFASEANAAIQCVAVAPFEPHHKDRFIAFYFLLNNAEMALMHEYDGALYDVMILGQTDDKKLLHESIGDWLLRNGQSNLVNTIGALEVEA